MCIGQKIKKYRMENKMTQTELGNAVGKSLPIIQKYESGRIVPHIDVIERIAKVLNVNPADIYLDEGIAGLERKYNELLEKYNETVNENNCLKAELKELQVQNSINYDLIKYQKDQINKLQNLINN